MASSRYVHISHEEFTEFATSKQFKQIEDKRSHEYVYERIAKHGHARMLIYSTISIFGGGGRKIGKDAIRLVLQVKREGQWTKSGFKFKRVHRTKNWRNNLTNRMKDAADNIHKETCPECGHALLKRESEFGIFYACCMWNVTGCNGKRM